MSAAGPATLLEWRRRIRELHRVLAAPRGGSAAVAGRLTLADLLWAVQSEAYVWRSTQTFFANETLLDTWAYQLDLFFA
jgi:hypothetical protein